MSRLTASRAAFDLIASFEGFRTRAALAPDGQWTFGFGHTATAREGLTVTRAEAEDLLRWDLLQVEDMVRQAALTPLTQSQFDALISFVYNIGIENFRTSDVLKYLNQGQPIAAALSMHAWRRAPVNGRVLTIDALVRRRAAESAMFLETVGARPAAPSSVVRPQIDYSAAIITHASQDGGVIATETAQTQDIVKGEDNQIPAANGDPVGKPLATLELTDELTEANEPREQIETITPTATVAEAVQRDVLVQVSDPVIAKTAKTDVLPQNTNNQGPEVQDPEEHDPNDQGPEEQGPVVLPPVAIPPLAELGDAKSKTDGLAPPLGNTGPMVPDGLSPFPGSAVYRPANGTHDAIIAPANDGQKTRLHNAPELLVMPTPDQSVASKEARKDGDGVSVLALALMALGAVLLSIGLYFSWKSGILTVTTPRREPTVSELWALLAAASGFLILITSAVSALTSSRDEA